jgi:hypothetical protein
MDDTRLPSCIASGICCSYLIAVKGLLGAKRYSHPKNLLQFCSNRLILFYNCVSQALIWCNVGINGKPIPTNGCIHKVRASTSQSSCAVALPYSPLYITNTHFASKKIIFFVSYLIFPTQIFTLQLT